MMLSIFNAQQFETELSVPDFTNFELNSYELSANSARQGKAPLSIALVLLQLSGMQLASVAVMA